MTKLCMCFDAGCFYLEHEMYMPRAHLKKGALRPYYHYYQLSLVAEEYSRKVVFLLYKP